MDDLVRKRLESELLADMELSKHTGGCLGYAIGIVIGVILCIILAVCCA